MKKNIRPKLIKLAVVFIVFLTIWSIAGAFMGAEKAGRFFRSLPLSIFWGCFIALLWFGVIFFRSLTKNKWLLLIHIGAMLTLAGFMFSSRDFHNLRSSLLHNNKFHHGKMMIYEGQKTDSVELDNGVVRKLDFALRLKDFRIKYYDNDYLAARNADSQSLAAPALPGSFVTFDNNTKVTILRRFNNFKLRSGDDGGMVAYDSEEPGSNSALEVEVSFPDGSDYKKFVFAKFPEQKPDENGFQFIYYKVIREYISEIEVIKNGLCAVHKEIKVNHPLHFGGYHFYQVSYDQSGNRYTVLEVVSDSGFYTIFAGYAIMMVGFFGRFFLTRKESKCQ